MRPHSTRLRRIGLSRPRPSHRHRRGRLARRRLTATLPHWTIAAKTPSRIRWSSSKTKARPTIGPAGSSAPCLARASVIARCRCQMHTNAVPRVRFPSQALRTCAPRRTMNSMPSPSRFSSACMPVHTSFHVERVEHTIGARAAKSTACRYCRAQLPRLQVPTGARTTSTRAAF